MEDILLKNGKCYLYGQGLVDADILIEDGKIKSISKSFQGKASHTIDVNNNLVIPGVIDSHAHIGIYRDFQNDAKTESKSAVAGGVTTLLSYFRTGKNYLNKTGSYTDILPELFEKSKGSFYTDYGFNIGPNTKKQLDEIQYLIDSGVSTFKFYMFYKGLNLKSQSVNTSVEKEYLLSDDRYDLGYLWNLMKKIASQGNRNIRLSIHAEEAEIIKDFIDIAKKEFSEQKVNEMQAYSEARPPESEYIAIYEALSMASLLKCPINLLHVSSEKAMKAIEENRLMHPNLDIMVEVTASHITLDNSMGLGLKRKVNPPIRQNTDVEYLWNSIIKGEVNTISSDHAALTSDMKGKDLWNAENGYGATELLLPSVIDGGYFKRGIPLDILLPLITYNQAKYHGMLNSKGSIALGKDADLTIIDLKKEKTVKASELHSAQDFTPFEGLKLKGWPTTTIVGGKIIMEDNNIISQPTGKFIKRPEEY